MPLSLGLSFKTCGKVIIDHISRQEILIAQYLTDVHDLQ